MRRSMRLRCLGLLSMAAVAGCGSPSSAATTSMASTSMASTSIGAGASSSASVDAAGQTSVPDAAEKLRRLNILAPVLTGFSPKATQAQAASFTCYLGSGVSSALLGSAPGSTMTPTQLIGRDVLIGMLACPAADWAKLPAFLVGAKIGSQADIAAAVAKGQAALTAG